MGRGYGNLMCTVVQDLPEQLLLTPATPGPVMEPCRRRRYRRGARNSLHPCSMLASQRRLPGLLHFLIGTALAFIAVSHVFHHPRRQ